MTHVDPTQPPQPQPKPEEVLAAFWQAKQARDYWAAEEKRLRFMLADMYCNDPNSGGYKSRTLDIGGGNKLEMTVTRSIKVATQNEHYLAWHKQASADEINTLFITKPSTLAPSLSGFNKLSEETRAAIAPAITFDEAISATFKAPKDER